MTLPDIPLSWAYNFVTGAQGSFHGDFTHSIVFVLLFLVLGLLFYVRRNRKWASIMTVISAGWFMHLALDWIYGGGKGFLWPFLYIPYVPSWNLYAFAPEIDAILLVLWIVHEEVHGFVRDYF